MSESSTFSSQTLSSRYTSPEQGMTAVSLHGPSRNVAEPWSSASRHFMDQQQYSRINTLPAGQSAAAAGGLNNTDDEFQFRETSVGSRGRRTLLSYRSVISAPDPVLVRQIAEVVGSQRPPALYVPDVVSLTPPRSAHESAATTRTRAAPMVYTTENEGDGSPQRSYRVVENNDVGDGLAALGKMRAARRSAAAAVGRTEKKAAAPLSFLTSKEAVQTGKTSMRRPPPPPPPTAGDLNGVDASFSGASQPMRTVDAVKYRNEATTWLMDVDEGLQALWTALDSGGKVSRLSNAMRLDPKYVQQHNLKCGALAPIHPLDAPRKEQRLALDEFVQAIEAASAASVELVSTYLTQEEKRFLGVNTHRYQSSKQRSSSYQYCKVKPRAPSSKSESATHASRSGSSAAQRQDVSTLSSQSAVRKAGPTNDVMQLLNSHRHASQPQRSADISMNSSSGNRQAPTASSRGLNNVRERPVPETVVTKRETSFAYPPAPAPVPAPARSVATQPPTAQYNSNFVSPSNAPVARTEIRRLPDIPSLVVSQPSPTLPLPNYPVADSVSADNPPDAVARTSSSYSTRQSQHHEVSATPTEHSENEAYSASASQHSSVAAAQNRAKSASHRSGASSIRGTDRDSDAGTAATELVSQHEQARRRSSSVHESSQASEYSNLSFNRGRGRQPFGDTTPSDRSYRATPPAVGDPSTLREFGVEESRNAQTHRPLLPPRRNGQHPNGQDSAPDDAASVSSVGSRLRRLAPPPPPSSLPKRANSRSQSNRGSRLTAPHLPAGRSSSIGTHSVPLSGFSTPAVHTPRTVESSIGGDMLQLKRLPIPIPSSYEPFDSRRGQSPPTTGGALTPRHDFKNLIVQSDSD